MIAVVRAAIERVRRKIVWTRRQRRGFVHYPSAYLNWMSFANAGMLAEGQRHLIDVAVRGLPTDDPVVEIGSFCGLSTNVITYFLLRHGRRNPLFTTDPWVFEGEGGLTLPDSRVPFVEYRTLVREQFERNVRFWSRDRLPHALTATSDEFFAAWHSRESRRDLFGREIGLGGPIAFCFIDGNHSREHVERDFRNADKLLVPGGFLLFDDSDEFGAFPQITEVVRQAIHVHGYELVGVNPHHLLRKP